MEYTGFAVVKASHDPEVFWIMFSVRDDQKPGHRFDSTNDLGESELRAELKKMGVSEARGDVLIQQAREQFNSAGAPTPA